MVVKIDDPFDVYAGDQWSQTFVIKSGPSGGPYDVVDLDQWENWTAQWRTTATAKTAIDLDVEIVDAANGVIRISATEAKTRQMGASGVWDIQAGAPYTRTFLRGKTKWTLDVTRG